MRRAITGKSAVPHAVRRPRGAAARALALAGAGLAACGMLSWGPPALGEQSRPAVAAVPAAAAMRTVVYDGYEATVPASWPVYRLDAGSAQCVRYDVHAVYLGVPGLNEDCPARLFGRTETVTLSPLSAAQVSAATAGMSPAGMSTRAGGEVRQDSAAHMMAVAVPGGEYYAGMSATATYGADPAMARKVLASVRVAPAGAQPTPATRAGVQAASATPAGGQAGTLSVAAQAAPASAASPVLPAAQAADPVEGPAAVLGQPVYGLDTCNPPSLATMRAWRPYYAVIAIYLGGANAACASPNLTPAWVAAVVAMGWRLLPTYVGVQAPCYGSGSLIDVSQAPQEGALSADDAIREATALHLAAGSPIYFDMEGYTGGASCSSVVLNFLNQWTRQLNARGWISGVYGSQDSGIAAIQGAVRDHRAGFQAPQAIWIAQWDHHRNLGSADLLWPPAGRSRQFIGPHNLTIANITLNIDTDWVASPTASLTGG